MLMKKKHYLPALIIFFFLIISVYYVFFRENEIEVNLDKGKFIISEKIRNIELEKIPIRLQLDFEKLLKDNKAVQLRKEWSTELNFDITLSPYFDLRNLYLISFDKLAVYDKASMQNIWKKQLDADIVSFSLIDGNSIMLIDKNYNVFALNRNTGDTVWSHNFNEMIIGHKNTTIEPFQITYNEDRRFLSSVIIVVNGTRVKVLDNISGDILSEIDLEHFVYKISEYDQIDNAIYIVYDDKIAKLILEKR